METYKNDKGSMNVGHICDCGKNHKWSGYVFAHWDIDLVMKCECGKKIKLYRGTITEVEDV